MQVQQTSSKDTVIQMQNRLLTIRKKLECIENVDARLQKVANAIDWSNIEQSALCRQVDDLGNSSRSNNLVIRGVREEGPESDDDLLKKVYDIFGFILYQKLDSIERIHRLRKRLPCDT